MTPPNDAAVVPDEVARAETANVFEADLVVHAAGRAPELEDLDLPPLASRPVYSILALAAVGMTEQEAHAKGLACTVNQADTSGW